jgi:hypothetical protein
MQDSGTGDGDRPASHRGLSGTGDTRTSTLGSQKSSPGSRPVKALILNSGPSDDSPVLCRPRETDSGSQSLLDHGNEDLFNSTFRLTPERVWKPKKSDPSKSISSSLFPLHHPEPVRLSRQESVGRAIKRRPMSLEQEQKPVLPERRMPIIHSRRIIRTVRNVQKEPLTNGFTGLGEKYDLLLPPRFKK